MPLPSGLEELRQIFKDNRTHIAIAKIKELSLASDRSFLKCLVSVFPEQREMVCRMSWEVVGPESGIFAFPAVNDLVLIACADGDEELAFVIRRLTSKEDKIPLQAATGDTAIVSLNGKKTWISSNTRINLSKGSTEPTENLVLGQVLKTLLSDILTELSSLAQALSTHTHIGNLGFPTAPPVQSAAIVASKTVFDNKKANPVNNNGILSNVSFTEKG